MTDVSPTAFDGAVDQYEAYWVDRLAKQARIELPYGSHKHETAKSGRYGETLVLETNRVNALRGNVCAGANRIDCLTATFLIYMARISDTYSFDVGFSYPLLRRESMRSGGVLSSHVPLHIELDPWTRFGASLEYVQSELESTRRHATFVRDIVSRHPQLGLSKKGDDGPTWPVVLEQVESRDEHPPLADCDLAILCVKDGVEMRWLYNETVFSEDDVATMQRQFVTFLEHAGADSQRAIAGISPLTTSEYHRITVEWNGTQVDYPLDRCIHQLFEAQAQQTPDHIAAIFEQRRLTYAELNQRANQLAHWLRAQGVESNMHVGIAVERSLEMLVGLYAIMKAGGVYVPLEPSYPRERIAGILNDADISIVLTQAHLRHVLPAEDVQVVCLDADWDAMIAGESVENPDCRTTLEDPAYTIYTSGSTGEPKGVMNTHRGILNRLFWMQDMFGLTPSDRVLHKTPFSFDVSVWELFWPFMYGATLVVARPEGHKDNDYLVRTIVEQQITLMHFVPSMLQLFLQTQRVADCRSLKHVICSGETLSADLRDRFFAQLDARLHNLYGPTEAAVDVTSYECRREDRSSRVPIGRPVANTQVYVLDRFMQPVPVGVPGQLYIGGVQLARGYLNRPRLTAESFVPDPFCDDPRGRLYKTGDLVRYLSDGNIEFLGRLDHQVKLQGFRIELGEIESLLNQHPAIRAAATTVHGDAPGDRRLVAYLVSEVGSPLSDRHLRDYLGRRLPDHMVPTAFVWLEALPLTANGKIDRRRLPAPTTERPLVDVYKAPGSEVEKIIVDIWQDVLKVDKVGIEDNFFGLGGNSFLSILVVARMREALGVDIPVTRIFQSPTVEALVRCLRSGGGDQGASETVERRAQRRKTALSRKRVVK